MISWLTRLVVVQREDNQCADSVGGGEQVQGGVPAGHAGRHHRHDKTLRPLRARLCLHHSAAGVAAGLQGGGIYLALLFLVENQPLSTDKCGVQLFDTTDHCEPAESSCGALYVLIRARSFEDTSWLHPAEHGSCLFGGRT